MLKRIIDFHLEHRWFVLIGVLGIVALGAWAMLRIPMDAFPDLTNNQVVVITECPGMAPSEVEQLVTFPIETALMGIPGTEGIRSISKLGLSIVTVLFDDCVNTYFARQLVNERLQEARTRLPDGLEPALGPVATAFGEVYQYTLEGPGYSAMDLKTMHEWQIKNQLRTVPGVNEINTWGGETRQYHIEVDPARLQGYGLTLRDVFERVRENNANFGGGFIEHASEQYTVLGAGPRAAPPPISHRWCSCRARARRSRLRDVATVRGRADAAPGRRAARRQGRDRLRHGDHAQGRERQARDRASEGAAGHAHAAAAALSISGFYDQSAVIDRTIHTVKKNLVEGGVLVMPSCCCFCGNIRAALIVAAVIPLSMLVASSACRRSASAPT